MLKGLFSFIYFFYLKIFLLTDPLFFLLKWVFWQKTTTYKIWCNLKNYLLNYMQNTVIRQLCAADFKCVNPSTWNIIHIFILLLFGLSLCYFYFPHLFFFFAIFSHHFSLILYSCSFSFILFLTACFVC